MRRARYLPRAAPLAIDAAAFGGEFMLPTRGEPFARIAGNAVVDIRGPLMSRDDWCFDNYDAIRARVDAALASDATTVVLRIDSPGGEVAGCFELSAELRGKAKAAGKPLVAYVDGTCASAAYAIACAAERIYAPPSAVIGSIGVIVPVLDVTAMDRAMGVTFAFVTSGARKADGNPHVATTEATIAATQGTVDAMAALFFALVAGSRGMKPEAVAGLEAATFVGAAAVTAGLADAVLTFDGLLAMVASGTTTAQVGAEDGMTEREKAIAALKALADDGDEKAAAALKAMSDDDDKDEKKDADAKAASSDDDKDAPPAKKDDDDKDAKASAVSNVIALAAKVQTLSAKIAAKEEAEERATLVATRPDFAPEVVAFLAKQPLATVRDAVKTLPKGAPAPKSPVAAARAAIATAPTTRGDGQGEQSAQADHDVAEMDRRMGRGSQMSAIRNDGTRQYIGVMTPAQARAELASRSKAVAK